MRNCRILPTETSWHLQGEEPSPETEEGEPHTSGQTGTLLSEQCPGGGGPGHHEGCHTSSPGAHQEPGQLPTELPYEEHGHQENVSYHARLRSDETPHSQQGKRCRSVNLLDSLVWRGASTLERLKVPTGLRSVCQWLGLLSPTARPMRRQLLVKAPGSHCLLTSHEPGRSRTLLLHWAMDIPISYCPGRALSSCVKGKDLPSQEPGVKACFSIHQCHLHICLPVLTASSVLL